MRKDNNDILTEVAGYYSAKILEHGAVPRGVDWNGKESQFLRFQQLSKIIRKKNAFSINDIGCGYGAFADFLNEKYRSFIYTGIDVSEEMIRVAQELHKGVENISFMKTGEPDCQADYSIASGIFNVRQQRIDAEWLAYIESTLDMLNRNSALGFAFNCLTSYSDHDKMRDYLYYANPCHLFDICKNRYSRHVSLLHDYGLYEFTIIVRKDL